MTHHRYEYVHDEEVSCAVASIPCVRSSIRDLKLLGCALFGDQASPPRHA
jgi:hypothetical protein